MKKKIVFGISALLTMVLLALIIYLIIILAGQYVVNDQSLVMKTTTSLVDQEGHLLTQLFIENRELVSIEEIPEHVQQAFIAIEDTRFREHLGIDFRSIGRALYRDILAGAKVEGGSTITQQLAKNAFLSNEKTWLRKTKEVLIAMSLERQYSKDEILEMYLNRIYFGHGAYGIQAASKLYFNKPVAELTVDEGALLAGLPKAPNSYSPLVDSERSKQRRDLVLTVMERQGYISAEEAVRLQGRTVAADHNSISENEAYLTYIDMVLNEAEQRYQLTNEEVLEGGYTIVVPMNRHVQEAAFQKVREDRFFPEGNEDAEAAFVLIDADTGGVLAVQGGREYVRKGLNRVNVKRQPGSALKPLSVFAPALETGIYHPYSLLKDELVEYDGGYTPRNYQNEYAGNRTMYESLTHSVNAPAVWLLNEIGIERALPLLKQFGLELPDRGLAIALGGLQEGVTPLELATAYRVFAEEGKRVEPYFIQAIYDRNGHKIGEAPVEEEAVVSPQTAWYMTRMLESVVKEGTGTNGTVNSPLAGKTGTTTYPDIEGATMDAWFVGYTPTVVGAAWMGYDVTSTDHYLRGGSSYPTVLFKEIINELPGEMREVAFEKPMEVQELDPPVDLPVIDDLEATMAMGGRGVMSVQLLWSAPTDERIYYQIYEVDEGERTRIATVVNENHYFIGSLNPFSNKRYQIVPYDSTTEQTGQPSNVADVHFRFGFH